MTHPPQPANTEPFDDPRLAAIYDDDNPTGPDHDFFRRLADETGASSIIDLGCGTGLLTATLGREGRRVVGIDPAAAMLEQARRKFGAERVEWHHGTSALMETASADLVIMSANVAMHIIGDAWPTVLADIARALRPGGRLAFESRNPAAELWREWAHPERERVTAIGRVRESLEITPPDADGALGMHVRSAFLDAGDPEPFDFSQPLQFRSAELLTAQLADVGLVVERISSDWVGTPFSGSTGERLMVFEAVKRA